MQTAASTLSGVPSVSASARTRPPLVSLGLPVFNGENYLRPALASLVAQTYTEWEMIISDNGSTDATPEICREFQARDPRIRYYREEINRGATWNFNRVFTLSRGTFFRWAAHDDVCEPDLLERCVAGLLRRPEAVLCHPRTRVIGPAGQFLYDDPVRLRTASERPADRFHDLICVDHGCYQIFGLMRVEVLGRTPLLGEYAGADRNLLAELALHGPFLEIPQRLFLRRDHPGTTTRMYPDPAERTAWFAANGQVGRHPTLKRGVEYGHSLLRAPLAARDRVDCLAQLGKWFGQRARSALRRATRSWAYAGTWIGSQPGPAR